MGKQQAFALGNDWQRWATMGRGGDRLDDRLSERLAVTGKGELWPDLFWKAGG